MILVISSYQCDSMSGNDARKYIVSSINNNRLQILLRNTEGTTPMLFWDFEKRTIIDNNTFKVIGIWDKKENHDVFSETLMQDAEFTSWFATKKWPFNKKITFIEFDSKFYDKILKFFNLPYLSIT